MLGQYRFCRAANAIALSTLIADDSKNFQLNKPILIEGQRVKDVLKSYESKNYWCLLHFSNNRPEMNIINNDASGTSFDFLLTESILKKYS